MTIRIAVVNHKGGVGKTTLVYHLALILGERGHSVLCVDADPQCNLSTLLLTEEPFDRLLDESDKVNGRTLWSLVAHKQTTDLPLRVRTQTKNVALSLIPGDVKMHRYEEQLALCWARQREDIFESMEVLTRLGRLLAAIEKRAKIDFVIFDTAPSLGALNRNVVLESDFLVIPVGEDLFSARGLSTLGRSLVDWLSSWAAATKFTPPDFLSRPGEPILGGYVMQRIPRMSTARQRKGVARVQSRIRTDLMDVLSKYNKRLARGKEINLRLGSISEFPAMSSIQDSSQPIWQNNPEAREEYEHIADRLLGRIKAMR